MSPAEQSRVVDRLGALLFVAAIFASAFLLFVVQPMVGKRILPWFGGAPAVWTLCLAFYQTTLFLGYAYAHLLIRFARPSLQLGIHALVFTCAVVSLPVLPGDAWKQGALGEPSSSILAMLSANVALPFLVLAATGPLVQAWFARRYPDRSPYPLYAVSNFGSLLALLGYPILIEPRLPLSTTGGFWSIAFTCTAAAVLACAALARRDRAGVAIETAAAHSAGDPWRPWRVVLWFLLAGSAVVVLMGVTNQLCLNLASVPFLWILPLVAYLASFILCFGSERAYRRAPYVVLMGVALFLCYGGPLWGPTASRFFHDVAFASSAMIAFHLLLLFATCMVLHGELYRLRPPARSLTAFYLFVSGGGALGGIFVGVVAPRIFDRYSELPLGLALAWLALLASCWHDARGWLHAGVPRWRWGIVGALTLALFAYVGERAVDTSDRVIREERTFFGVLRVVEGEIGEPRRLYSGTTIHGAQFLHSSLRRSATSYYGAITGIGFALQQEGPRGHRRIGVVGLGAGTLAAYGRPGDSFRFYEIDPAVIRVARDEGYFTFLADSEAEIAIVPGDARLSLAEEQTRGATQDFDVLVVDAFNSDAIPVHLLTREAFEIYAGALHEGGLLAVHVSNAHLDLVPLVSHAGHSVGMSGLHVDNVRAPRRLSLPAEWIVLSRDAGRIRSLEDFIERRREELRLNPQMVATQRLDDIAFETGPLWTDDYSDLFGLLRVRAKRGDLDVPPPTRPAR